MANSIKSEFSFIWKCTISLDDSKGLQADQIEFPRLLV